MSAAVIERVLMFPTDMSTGEGILVGTVSEGLLDSFAAFRVATKTAAALLARINAFELSGHLSLSFSGGSSVEGSISLPVLAVDFDDTPLSASREIGKHGGFLGVDPEPDNWIDHGIGGDVEIEPGEIRFRFLRGTGAFADVNAPITLTATVSIGDGISIPVQVGNNGVDAYVMAKCNLPVTKDGSFDGFGDTDFSFAIGAPAGVSVSGTMSLNPVAWWPYDTLDGLGAVYEESDGSWLRTPPLR